MIKGIIFDLGHTLLEFNRELDEVAREGAETLAEWYHKKKRIQLDQADLVETFLAERESAAQQASQSRQEIPLRQTLEVALSKIEAPAATKSKMLLEAAIKIYFAPEQAAWQAYPDAISTLKLLKGHYRLGLYSNATDDAYVQRLINENKLRPELSITFSSAGLGWRKPAPQGFALIAQRWGLPVEQIVVVGDALEVDILGAQNAGMPSILVERQAASTPNSITPTALVNNLAELPQLISEL